MGRLDEHVEKQLLRRLELCYRLGKGAYGMVWKVIEKRTRRVVVLKKCFDVLGRPEDAQRMYRETMFLRRMIQTTGAIGAMNFSMGGDRPGTQIMKRIWVTGCRASAIGAF